MAKKKLRPVSEQRRRRQPRAAFAAPALPANWAELFCREADYGSLLAALVLLHSTYPPSTTGDMTILKITKLLKMMVPRRMVAVIPLRHSRIPAE